ncbi:MAG: ribokinase [bacterium]
MPDREPRICVVGATNIDLIAKVPRLPRLGETLPAESFQVDCGGKGANQAVMARRIGARVSMVTRIGRDVFGERAFKNYEEQGIETAYVAWDEERPSGIASILVDDRGRNAIVYVPGANFGLSPADVRAARDAIGRADAVICQLEVPLETTAEALRTARRCRRPLTIFNPAPAGPISDDLIALCDVIVPNEVEAEAITGIAVRTLDDARAAARRLLDAGTSAAVITLGARGALVAGRSETLHVPALPVDAVDSTGAGDAFIGTLAYFLARAEPLSRAARLATAAAALSVTKIGTQASFPSRAEFDEFAGRVHEDR